MRMMGWYFRSLRRAFGLPGSAPTPGASLPLNLPWLDIDLAATAEEQRLMFERVRGSWTHLGAVRPHFSVLTEDAFRPGNIGQSIGRFWTSGEIEATIIDAVLARCGFAAGDDKTCVEYGSGVGRLTIPLAARFGAAHAYDISATHLDLARQRAGELGVGNIHFHHCAEAAPDQLEACDFFYSRLVFQHNPPPLIRTLIRSALRSLRDGGVALFGVPTHLPGYRFRAAEYLAMPQPMRAEMHCIPQSEVFALARAENCSVIEVREERGVGPAGESLSNVFVIRRPFAAREADDAKHL